MGLSAFKEDRGFFFKEAPPCGFFFKEALAPCGFFFKEARAHAGFFYKEALAPAAPQSHTCAKETHARAHRQPRRPLPRRSHRACGFFFKEALPARGISAPAGAPAREDVRRPGATARVATRRGRRAHHATGGSPHRRSTGGHGRRPHWSPATRSSGAGGASQSGNHFTGRAVFFRKKNIFHLFLESPKCTKNQIYHTTQRLF